MIDALVIQTFTPGAASTFATSSRILGNKNPSEALRTIGNTDWGVNSGSTPTTLIRIAHTEATSKAPQRSLLGFESSVKRNDSELNVIRTDRFVCNVSLQFDPNSASEAEVIGFASMVAKALLASSGSLIGQLYRREG